jgi:DNA invertase Pin-like site-specific DNA recombinase
MALGADPEHLLRIQESVVALLIVIALIVVLAAFGFFWHVLWLGVLVGVVALLTRVILIGLDSDKPAGRLNIGVVNAFGRYLLEISERARHRGRRTAARRAASGGGGVEVVEVVKIVEPFADNSAAGRGNATGTMTEQKTSQALVMAESGMTQAAIAEQLGVSPSTVSRHLRRRRSSKRMSKEHRRTRG